MIRFFILGLLTISCSKHISNEAVAKKDPVKLNGKYIEALELKDYYSTTDTFTLFFFPEKGKMNWDSEVFDKNDSDVEKLSDIVARVIKLSDLIDFADKKSYELLLKNKEIQAKLEENSCEDDDFGDIDDDFKDTKFNICESLNQEAMENSLEMARLSSSEKGKYLRGIQEAIDNVIFKKIDDSTFLKEGVVTNWIPYGDQNSYVFKLFNDSTENKLEFNPEIILPTLGSPANKYSTIDKDIYDVTFENSIYAPATKVLKFKVKEKGLNGACSGFIWEAELEKSNFAGKIRFSGDVFRKDQNGKLIQQGIMKFELAKNDNDIGDIDF